jgi:hypothetical protein
MRSYSSNAGRGAQRTKRVVAGDGKLSARRPVSRVLCRTTEAVRRWPSISGRRSPDGSCGRPEGCAAHIVPANRGVALLFGLAPGRACLVSLHGPARRPDPASSLWRWSSPRGGWGLPTTLRWGARTFLTPAGLPRPTRSHPAVSLTPRFYPGSPISPAGGPPTRGRPPSPGRSPRCTWRRRGSSARGVRARRSSRPAGSGACAAPPPTAGAASRP